MNLGQEVLFPPEDTTIRRGNSRTGSKHEPGSKAVSRINSVSGPRNHSQASASQPPNAQPAANPPLTEKLVDQVPGDRPLSPPANAKTYMFEFQVEDTGPGIPEHLQQKVFEPFVQGDLRLSKKYGGTGLGLSICAQLAKLMQGTIELKSLEEAGTTFTLRIPLKYVKEHTPSISSPGVSRKNSIAGPVTTMIDRALPETASQKSSKSVNTAVSFSKNNKPRLVGLSQPFFAPGSREPTPNTELAGFAGSSSIMGIETGDGSAGDVMGIGGAGAEDTGRIRVLVAEDNRVNQEVVLKMLKLEDIYDVTIAKDGQEAVDRIKEALEVGKNFHLVLMDIQVRKALVPFFCAANSPSGTNTGGRTATDAEFGRDREYSDNQTLGIRSADCSADGICGGEQR